MAGLPDRLIRFVSVKYSGTGHGTDDRFGLTPAVCDPDLEGGRDWTSSLARILTLHLLPCDPSADGTITFLKKKEKK